MKTAFPFIIWWLICGLCTGYMVRSINIAAKQAKEVEHHER